MVLVTFWKRQWALDRRLVLGRWRRNWGSRGVRSVGEAEGAKRPALDDVKRGPFAVGRREAGVHVREEEAGEVDVDGERDLVGSAGRRVREPNAEAAARRAVLDPGGDGHAGLEVDAWARGRDGED